MSDLTASEKRLLERHLGMGGGYVLDFNNRTFAEFMIDTARVDPYDAKYSAFSGSGSKANLLRAIWKVEPNHVVGKILSEMLTLCADGSAEHEQCLRIASRLVQSAPVDLDALSHDGGSRDFDMLVRDVEAAIGRNEPEAGLDRLHTYTVKFFRSVASGRGVVVEREKPLHSIVGEYIKVVRAAGLVESDMAERILRSAISTLEAFNKIRNERSLAHDNKPLGYDESLLVFNHVCGVIRFVRALEERDRRRVEDERRVREQSAPSTADDEIPF